MKTAVAFLLSWISYFAAGQGAAQDLLLNKADSLYAANDFKGAIPLYEKALKNNDKNAVVLSKLAYSMHQTRKPAAAIDYYRKAIAMAPPANLLPTIHSRMARALAMTRNADDAFAALDLAVKSGYALAGEMQNHVDYAYIRNDERFAGMVQRATNNAMPCLAMPQARVFDFWIGEWDVYPNGANVVVGHSKIERASGGCMILENWTALGPMPSEGKSMNFVNPATGKWEQLWVGSGGINSGNPQRFVDGEYRDNAMRFTFEAVNPQGQKLVGRFIFFNEGPDQVRQFNETSSDGGKTWTTSYDLVYKRKKS